jgi:hypothetical protein
MHLETRYKNPEVVLTTRLTNGQKKGAEYLRCLTVLLIAIYLVSMGMMGFFTLTTITLLAFAGGQALLYSRPRIVMNNKKKTLSIKLNSKFGKSTQLSPFLLERVVVESKKGPDGKKDSKKYFPRFIVKNKDKPKKKIFLNGFELDNIVEAHYVAQLVAIFANCRAFDIRGKVLPELKSHIPAKYLSEKSDNAKGPDNSTIVIAGKRRKKAAK